MKRIKTAFLKKATRAKKLKFVCVLELVESSSGTFYLLENELNYGTDEFKKAELFKSHNDLEEAEDFFNIYYQDKLAKKYKPAENGDVFSGLKFLLDYTKNYLEKHETIETVGKIAEQPRLIRI